MRRAVRQIIWNCGCKIFLFYFLQTWQGQERVPCPGASPSRSPCVSHSVVCVGDGPQPREADARQTVPVSQRRGLSRGGERHCNMYVYIRENVHQVGSMLFQTNFIITQLAMFYLPLLTCICIHVSTTIGGLLHWPLNIQFLKKATDGGRNVEVSRTLLVV